MVKDRRSAVVWAIAALAGVAIAMVLVWPRSVPRSRGGVRATARLSELTAVPAGARSLVSRVLGASEQQYAITRRNGRLSVQTGGLSDRFTASGADVSAGGTTWRLPALAGSVRAFARANRVSYRAGDVREWFAAGPLGLEQGFTVGSPLHARPSARLMLGIGPLPKTLDVSWSAGRRGLALLRDGHVVLRYTGLAARDAGGRPLPARLVERAGRLAIAVDSRGARYPVTVDPLVQAAALTPSGSASNQQFGYSVAVSGDTIVVGQGSGGAAYVFTEPAGGWSDATETARLTASDGASGDEFGAAVAIDGDTVAVGAFRAPAGGTQRGAVYVFVKPANGWHDATETAKLTASDGADDDWLGLSVAISGDTVVAGAPQATVVNQTSAGAVYVFVRPGPTWSSGTQTAKLTASDGQSADELGTAVAIDGDTVVAGAPHSNSGNLPGAVYEFTRPAQGWSSATQTAKLTDPLAGGLGNSVTVTGSVIAAGAPKTTVGGNSDAGAVDVFVKPNGGWSDAGQTARLTSSNPQTFDGLGTAVAASGSTIIAGEPRLGSSPGAVDTFDAPAGGWASENESEQLTDSGTPAHDDLGWAVAGSGSTVVAGAPAATVGSHTAAGAAYVFAPSASHQLTVSVGGTGSGVVTGPNITCPGVCSNTYAPGTQVTLQAEPRGGSTFAGWGGACASWGTSTTCELTMNADQSVTASFDAPTTSSTTTSTTTTATTTSTPGGGPRAPVAILHAISGTVPAGGTLRLSAVGSQAPGSAIRSYTFSLGSDGREQTVCPVQDPALSATVVRPVTATATLTVTAVNGGTGVATVPIRVTAAGHIPRVAPLRTGRTARYSTTALGQVPAISLECTPAAGAASTLRPAPPVNLVPAASQAPTINGGRADPACMDQISLGIVEGLGCFIQVDANHPLPQAEDAILCTYQLACDVIKQQSSLVQIGGSAGGSARRAGAAGSAQQAGAGQSPIDGLAADAIYYSTQPVRIDGLEIDPVNGSAIVLARAGLLESNFLHKDSAYLISSDAVVKVGDLPVSLHVPDYQALYQQGSNALNQGEQAINDPSSLDPSDLNNLKLPDPSKLVPTTDGKINLAVGPSNLGEEIGEFDVPGKILPVDDLPNLPLTGTVKVDLTSLGGASVAVHVELPSVLSDGNGHGLTGDTSLTIDNENGLELNSLHILVPSTSDLGLAELKNLEFTYSRKPQVFDGKMTLDLGYATVGGELRLENGDFKSASLAYQADEGEGIEIYGPVYLVALSGALSIDPTSITSTAQLSFGPAADTGCGPMGVTGTTTVSFGNPVAFDSSGAFELDCGNYGYNAGVHFDSDGNLAGRVGLGYSIPDVGKILGEVELQAYTDAKNVFIAQVDGRLEAIVDIHECVGPICADTGDINLDAQGAISIGDDHGHAVGKAGVCMNVSLLGAGFSVGAGTSDLPELIAATVGAGSFDKAAKSFSILWDGCDISQWELLKPLAGFVRGRAASTSYPVNVATGTHTEAIGITGDGSSPMVTLQDPSGKVINASTPAGISTIDGVLVVRDPSTDETLIEIPHARAGRWTVAPAAGSVPLRSVRSAHSLPKPAIHARVTGRLAHRVLRYRITRQPHLGVTFLERVDGGLHLIGVARRRSGLLRFTPALGSTRPRTVVAQVTRNGQPLEMITVARYRPGAFRPGRVTGVKIAVNRRGTRITFSRGANTTATHITVRFADGRELFYDLRAPAHRLFIAPHVDATVPTAVGLAGLRGTRRGPMTIVVAHRRRT